jgi:hypothetical protein
VEFPEELGCVAMGCVYDVGADALSDHGLLPRTRSTNIIGELTVRHLMKILIGPDGGGKK